MLNRETEKNEVYIHKNLTIEEAARYFNDKLQKGVHYIYCINGVFKKYVDDNGETKIKQNII